MGKIFRLKKKSDHACSSTNSRTGICLSGNPDL